MSPVRTRPMPLLIAAAASSLMTAALAVHADQVVIDQGASVDVQRYIDPGPEGRPGPPIGQDVQDLGDGGTSEGVPDVIVDPRDAALRDEKNLGPNAPGYIP
jgi:hypothetical protein